MDLGMRVNGKRIINKDGLKYEGDCLNDKAEGYGV